MWRSIAEVLDQDRRGSAKALDASRERLQNDVHSPPCAYGIQQLHNLCSNHVHFATLDYLKILLNLIIT